MADLFEAVSERLVHKRYNSSAIDSATEPDPATDPASSGGQTLRYRSFNLSLTKETFTPDEMRTDQQAPMPKEGTRRLPISIQAWLSCTTYEELFEEVLRGTWSVAAISISNSEMTSIAADNATSKFTFAGGDPVDEGLRVGDIFQLTNTSEVANNSINFLITGFGGTSNREMTVYPAPTDEAADTSFTLATIGRSLIAPSSSLVKRKSAFETYNSDADISRLVTEGRLSGLTVAAAPDQGVALTFTGMARNRKVYSTSSAPFFTAPTAETTTEIISSMDGLLLKNGAVVGAVTGVSFAFDRAPSAPAQLHSKGLTAGTVLANAVGTGQLTAFLADTTYLDLFDDPTTMKATEFSLMLFAPESAAADAHGVVFFLPRVKLTSNDESTVDGAKALSCNFVYARYLGSAAGVESTSLRIVDTRMS